MKSIIYLLVVSIFLFDYIFAKLGPVSRIVVFLPEILSATTIIIITLHVSATKRILIHPKYLIVLLIFIMLIFISMIVNQVDPAAFVNGLRNYFKYLPIFLLPAVFDLSKGEVERQLKLIFVLALIQCPIALYQRFIQFKGIPSGDVVVGTLSVSSLLSIFLISCIAMLFSFYLKKLVSLGLFLITLPILFFPTVINETKGTLFLLPIAIMIPTLIHLSAKNRSTGVMVPILLGLVLISGFIGLYNQGIGGLGNEKKSMQDFIASGDIADYLYKDVEGRNAGPGAKNIGKVDSYVLAWKHLSDDFVKLFIGLGVGNVSKPPSEFFQGDYDKYADLQPQVTALSYLLWETGIIGVMLVVITGLLILHDARQLSNDETILGGVALGWVAVVTIMIVSLGYKNILNHNVIGFLFWYISGFIAASRQQRHQADIHTFEETHGGLNTSSS